MKQLIFIITGFLLVLLALENAYAEKTILIQSDCVYLDELTAPHIAHNKVACGIMPGQTRYFSKEIIQTNLAKIGINAQVLDGVSVKREGEKLSDEDVKRAIISEYERAYSDTTFSLEQVRLPKEFFVESATDFKVNVDTNKFGSSYAEIKNGSNRSQVYFYVRAYKDGYIATDKIKAGETIADKVRAERIDITNSRVMPLAHVDGLIASKQIPQGKTLTPDLVENKPSLKKGESVKLVYNHNGIVIEAMGVAEENGFLGKPFAVRNTNSQKTVMASYAGNGVAYVR